MSKIPFKELCGKSIIGDQGGVIGRVTDVVFDEDTGKIISLDFEPSENSPIPSSEEYYKLIPFTIVKGIKDVVIIEEDKIDCIKIISKEEGEG